MATLTADRNTLRRNGDEFSYPMAASTKVFKGQPVCLDSSGNVVAASLTTGLKSVGVAETDVDNSAGLAAALSCPIRTGVYRLDIHGTLTKTSIGSLVYFFDQTAVQTSSTGASSAGLCVDVDSFGAWVLLGQPDIINSSGALLAANNLSDVASAETSLDNLTTGLDLVMDTDSIDTVAANALAIGATNATGVNLGATATPVTVSSAGAVAIPSTLSAAGVSTQRQLLQTKTNAYTVQTPAIDGGSTIQDLTDNGAITLPATSAANKGMKVTLQNTAANGAAKVQFTANAADAIYGTIGSVVVAHAAGAATLVNTKATANKGDFATLQSDGAGAWWIVGGVGVWA